MILREEGPYFTCMRCQRKVPISAMCWDDGKLVCIDFYCTADGSINGALELRWAKEAGLDKKERQPEPKLVEPVDPAQQLETIPASTGTY